MLDAKARQAADHQVAKVTPQPGQTPKQLQDLKDEVDAALTLLVRLQTSSEWINGTTVDLLNDEQLPDGLVRIEFDSSFLYRSRFNNVIPDHTFTVTIDLARTNILDFNNPPTLNASGASVLGLDATWANAVFDEITTFFRQRRTRRGWLHMPRSYDVLLILLGFPLSFDAVYRLDRVLRHVSALPGALSVAIYVYVVLLVLMFFRTMFNYARWAFPKLEINAPRQHVATAHRIAISTLALMVVGSVVSAVLKLFGIG